MTDLERAYAALAAKNLAYKTLFDYYDGNQPLVYSTERLREIFQKIDARFEQNWCAVVVDSVLERLTLKGWDSKDKTINAAIDALWTANELGLDAYDVHTAVLVASEAFVIAWPDEATGEPEAYYNDPRMCHVFYDPTHPRRKTFAAKWWDGDDGFRRLTLYYPDKIIYYKSTVKNENLQSANAFQQDGEELPNDYGEVPVFHWQRNRRSMTSELGNVVHIQDAINKLFADMMVAAEFGAFRQRYIIGNAGTKGLKNAPNEIWELPGGDGVGQATSVGEFTATDLKNYLDSMDKLAESVAIISRTPKHYLLSAGAGLSGDALIAMEGPLVKKCQRYIEALSVPWQQLGAFMLKIKGMTVNPSDLQPVWEDPRTIQPLAEAQSRKLAKEAGIPLNTLLRREGWDQGEIAQMQKDAQEEKSAQTSMAQAVLAQVRQQFDQGKGGQQVYSERGNGQPVPD